MRLIQGEWVDRGGGGRRTRLSTPDSCMWCSKSTQMGEVFPRDDGTVSEVGCCARCWMEHQSYRDREPLQVIPGGRVA